MRDEERRRHGVDGRVRGTGKTWETCERNGDIGRRGDMG